MKNLFILLSLLFVVACGNDADSGLGEEVKGDGHDSALVANPQFVFASSGCKSSQADTGDANQNLAMANGFSDIRYEVSENGTLTVFHNDAEFGCDADFDMSSTVEGNVINIIEKASASTNCICRYDLSFSVGPLTDGTYTVNICSDNVANVMHHFDVDIVVQK